jgi:hypothetical protein
MKNSARKKALKSKHIGVQHPRLCVGVSPLMNQGLCGYLALEYPVV